MSKKINTMYFGEKNLLDIKPIPDVNGLYIGEIGVVFDHSRYRMCGVFDDNYREVVPFGVLHPVFGTRVVNENTVILDCSSTGSLFDFWHQSGYDSFGSILLIRDGEEFKHVYTSNASIMYVTHDMVYGANFDDFGDYSNKNYIIRTFEYNYKENKLVNSVEFDGRATITGDLALYFNEAIMPYPSKMHRMVKVGNVDNKTLYEFYR